MTKAKDLRDQSNDELTLKAEMLKGEIFKLRSQKLDAQTQQTHLIRDKKRDVARVLTILRERGN